MFSDLEMFLYPSRLILFNNFFTELVWTFCCLCGVTVSRNTDYQWLDIQRQVSSYYSHLRHIHCTLVISISLSKRLLATIGTPYSSLLLFLSWVHMPPSDLTLFWYCYSLLETIISKSQFLLPFVQKVVSYIPAISFLLFLALNATVTGLTLPTKALLHHSSYPESEGNVRSPKGTDLWRKTGHHITSSKTVANCSEDLWLLHHSRSESVWQPI